MVREREREGVVMVRERVVMVREREKEWLLVSGTVFRVVMKGC